jgi:hypothetical protein
MKVVQNGQQQEESRLPFDFSPLGKVLTLYSIEVGRISNCCAGINWDPDLPMLLITPAKKKLTPSSSKRQVASRLHELETTHFKELGILRKWLLTMVDEIDGHRVFSTFLST